MPPLDTVVVVNSNDFEENSDLAPDSSCRLILLLTMADLPPGVDDTLLEFFHMEAVKMLETVSTGEGMVSFSDAAGFLLLPTHPVN